MQAEQTAWLQGQGIAATDSSEKYAQHAGGQQQATVLALFLGRGGSFCRFCDEISVHTRDIVYFYPYFDHF